MNDAPAYLQYPATSATAAAVTCAYIHICASLLMNPMKRENVRKQNQSGDIKRIENRI